MASMAENDAAKNNDSENEQLAKPHPETIELEQGRVWRRGSVASNADKQNGGPVLRTTVKPVKRFRPDTNSDKTNPSPSRKKRLKSTTASTACKSDEGPLWSQHEGKGKTVGGATTTSSSPDGKSSTTSKDVDKNEKGHTVEAQGDDSNPPVKKKRVWEQWTVEDKNYFFEAVATYGKDFEAIRTAIAQKQRRRGEECTAKTKDQVRHLYYRTWTMISKIIDADAYPLKIHKAFQELYAVINYGELRKKLGGNLKKKGVEKLNELIRDGTTSARFKGKNFRIKTPSCRALKKMHPDYQGKEGIHGMPLVSDTRRMKIPLHVTVELFPSNMAAWNQVHSIAHNPRIKVRLSVECQLSSLFAYLERKWKPLGGRIMCIADQSQSKNHRARQKSVKTMETSKWDWPLVFQTPPDTSVNTRIMVFQVSNNKTHCVVSYALRKSLKTTEKTRRDKVTEKSLENISDEREETSANLDAQNGCVSEPEVVDSSLSSEEDCDYDSAAEDAIKDNGLAEQDGSNDATELPGERKSFLVDDDAEVQTLDTSFVLKSKECLADCPPSTPEVVVPEENDQGEEQIDTNAATNLEKTDTISAIGRRDDQHESDNNDSVCEIASVEDSNFSSETDMVASTSVADCPANASSPGPHLQESDAACLGESDVAPAPEKISVSIPGIEPLSDVELSAEGAQTKKGEKLVVSSKLFQKSSEKKSRRYSKRSKAFVKTVLSWNANDCDKVTVAEVFMMLGKPSIFRLCYHWLQTAAASQPRQRADDDIRNDEQPEKCVSLSSGLAALIQAAELSRRVGTANADAIATEEKQPCPKAQAMKTKSTATQCELLKQRLKADEKSGNTSSTSSSSSNPHGRGVSKMVPVETVIVSPSNVPFAFAVPASPSKQPRKIAANPNKPAQRTMVSPETMKWLLQKERSRSRQLRRPIVVDRSVTSRSNRTINRPMKTFSIVTKAHKIGFLPSQPILPAGASSTSTSLAANSTAATQASTPSAAPLPPTTTISIEDLFGLDNDDANMSSVASDGNLLAQAAKQAGVTPPTPLRDTTADDAIPNAGTILTTVSVETNNLHENHPPSDLQQTQNHHDGASNAIYADSRAILVEDVAKDLAESDNRQEQYLSALPKGTSGCMIHAPQLDDLDIGLPAASRSTECVATTSSSVVTSSSLLLPDTTVVNSLPELSWPGHDISSSAFPIMNDNLIGKLVDGDDVVLSSFDAASGKNSDRLSDSGRLLVTPSLISVVDENSNGASQSRQNFLFPMMPSKTSDTPIHPWTINVNNVDGTGLLNTPQKILPADSDDSFDGLILRNSVAASREKVTDKPPSAATNLSFSAILDISKSGSKCRLLDQSSSSFLSASDPAVDLHLQCLMNENSVDLVSKFQDLVRHTTEGDELTVLASDEDARDGHMPMGSISYSGQGVPAKDSFNDDNG